MAPLMTVILCVGVFIRTKLHDLVFQLGEAVSYTSKQCGFVSILSLLRSKDIILCVHTSLEFFLSVKHLQKKFFNSSL